MIDIENYYEIDCPTWALPAIFNCDFTGLSDEEIALLCKFNDKYSDVVCWDLMDDEDEFNPYPAFGLATSTQTLRGYCRA